MLNTHHDRQSAALAARRLLSDQCLRPHVEQRTRLAILASRFERVGREALIGLVATRVKADPRYMPVLQELLRG